ncbi:hypothetical protein ARNL5_03423 [Anaerolineae bacterium]|nr:hypothetical protein ARNL5_03423 [Anaerolineae bacterium]
MKTLFYIFLTLSLISAGRVLSQDEQDTSQITEDTLETTEIDPVKAEISRIIKEVNLRAAEIDNIISTGEIKIKTPKIDEEGDIEIHVRKKDDLWFKIEGPLGIDAATGHFNRDRFVFFDDLNDVVTTGSTTILNIGTLTKIRCTFDDMMNAFSGTVRIRKGKKDILDMSEESGQYVLSLKRGTITRKYWVSSSDYSVSKYIYLSSKGQTLISFEFSNFSGHGTGSYARRIEIRRPKQNEYFRITLENVSLGQSYLDFKVDYPYGDVKMRTWK